MSSQNLNLILSEIKELNNKVNNIKQNMTTKSELEDVKQSMATKNELANIKQNMVTKKDLEDVKQIIKVVSEQVATNAENITEIKENQKVIGDVINQIADIQERQESTINLLARRSLDQEDEIRRIK